MLRGVIYYLAFHNLDNPFSYASFYIKPYYYWDEVLKILFYT